MVLSQGDRLAAVRAQTIRQYRTKKVLKMQADSVPSRQADCVRVAMISKHLIANDKIFSVCDLPIRTEHGTRINVLVGEAI